MSRLALLVAGAFFMEFLDGSIIATALPAMARSLGGSAVNLNVGVSVYMLTVAVFILPSGWMAERWGARGVFTAAVGVFTAGSVLCGAAGSVWGFVAARVVQGLGGAMMVPVGRLVVLRATPKTELMGAIALLTWPALSAPLIGPPLGGFIVQHASWRWIFLLNVPLGLAGIGLALVLVPGGRGGGRRPFDWVGFGLGALLCVCGVSAFELLGRAEAGLWRPAGLGVAAVGVALLLRWHLRRAAHPIVDFAGLGVGTFRAAILGGTAMRVLIGTMPFLLPLLFQLGFGLPPFRAGLLVLALFAGNLGIKPLTSPMLRRWGFRRVLVGNGLLQAASMAGCAGLAAGTPGVAVAGLLVVAGASRSLQFTALNTLAFADVGERGMAAANTLFSAAFQLALGLGVALGAVALRLAVAVLGAGGAPAGAFRLAFAAIAVGMAAVSVQALRLAPEAGARVVGGR